MAAERDPMILNEIPYSSLGVDERSNEAPRDGRAGVTPDPEVVAKPKRRQFTAEYRLRTLEEAARCTQPGEVGRLLRREGLYSTHLAKGTPKMGLLPAPLTTGGRNRHSGTVVDNNPPTSTAFASNPVAIGFCSSASSMSGLITERSQRAINWPSSDSLSSGCLSSNQSSKCPTTRFVKPGPRPHSEVHADQTADFVSGSR